MKRIIFVVNTLGQAGAETALLALLKKLDYSEHEVFLYVLMEQGEMIRQIPPQVRLLNSDFSSLSVFSKEGQRQMARTVCICFLRNGAWPKKLYQTLRILISMMKNRRFEISKMLWRMVSEGAERFEDNYDLAVAWLEGGSAYYVAEHVKARRKVAFIHIGHKNAGYTKEMDQGCWEQFDEIFAVSGEIKEQFQKFYPEYASKVSVFYNLIDEKSILSKAEDGKGFSDGYGGIRILTVGRLVYQKGYDIAVETMRLLKSMGFCARWYVLGEGPERSSLERHIRESGLEEDFLLLGAAENPYPYYIQADLYVHTARYEGKSIAIQEAQILGCAIIATDCNGNRKQIRDGTDGILCEPEPQAIAEQIMELSKDEEKRQKLGQTARTRKTFQAERPEKLLDLI